MPAANMDNQPEVESMVTALEEAIYKGNVDQAAQMAQELAKCRARLSIRLIAVGPPVGNTFRLDVAIESSASDKVLATTPLQVSPVLTVFGLKVKMALLFGIPMACQRWIIGKKIPGDEESLKSLGITTTRKVFLYVLEAKALKLSRGKVSEQEADLKKFHDDLLRKGNNPDLALTPDEYQRYLEGRREGQRQLPTSPQDAGHGTWGRRSHPRGEPIQAWAGQFTDMDGHHNDQGTPMSDHGYSSTGGSSGLPYHERNGANSTDSGFDRTDSVHVSRRAAPVPERQQPKPAKWRPAPPPPAPKKPTAKDVGWSCPTCTFVNPPRIPACRSCLGPRPEEYMVPEPDTYTMDPGEERVYLEEQQNELLLKEREEETNQQLQQARKNLSEMMQAVEQEKREEETNQQLQQVRQNLSEMMQAVEQKKWEEEEKNQQQLQAQVNLAEMMQAAEQNIVSNTEPFDCPVCFTEVEPGEGVKLRECLHDICRDCLENHINISNEPEVTCPYTDGENNDCVQVIPDREIKQIISEEDYNRYLQRGLNRAEAAAADAFHCKTANCVGLCFYDDEINFFDCEVCKKQNCLTCKAIHEGQNCKQYQEELKIKAGNDEAAKKTQEALEQMLKDGNAMKCPGCKIIIQKKSGCDWMQCSVCKVEICWVTKGPRWGPKGRGDNSGGCKCRYAATGNVGAKCHPMCGNCH